MFRQKIKFQSGALEDNRTQPEKDLDYTQNELVASIGTVTWTKKKKYRTFPKRMQNGSGSCVMQSLEKERGIIAYLKYGEYIDFSANPSYQLRANPDVAGSTYEDLIKATNQGGLLEVLSPSQSLTDSQMMTAVLPKYSIDISKIFGAKRITMDLDIDTIASTIENTKKGVGLTIRFGKGEWFNNSEVKERLTMQDWTMGHRVVAIDYTLNSDGEKCLVIDDSACEDGHQYRLVPERFLLNRTYWKPNYILNFKTYTELPDKPSYTGTITNLQDILKFEGFFPVNVDSTGVFGSVTKKALIAFQLKYGIEPAVGFFGDITKAKLKLLYP